MASKTVGLGSQCLCTHLDESGTPLDGGETYKLTVTRGRSLIVGTVLAVTSVSDL